MPAEKQANPRVTITLSAKAHEEMSLVAEQKGIPLSSHISNIVEAHHETPSYGNLMKRAKSWLRGETYEK
jgi:macrodomain Ter protein organizer (MatP/YcbG family)